MNIDIGIGMMAEWSKAVDLSLIQISTGAIRVSSNLTHVIHFNFFDS